MNRRILGQNETRCISCKQSFQPRQLQNGNWAQTCGRTACVVSHRSKQPSDYGSGSRYMRPRNWSGSLV
jgi:hypothetical protein